MEIHIAYRPGSRASGGRDIREIWSRATAARFHRDAATADAGHAGTVPGRADLCRRALGGISCCRAVGMVTLMLIAVAERVAEIGPAHRARRTRARIRTCSDGVDRFVHPGGSGGLVIGAGIAWLLKTT